MTSVSTETVGLLLSRIRDVPDYPKPGVMFKDITPLLADPEAFTALTDALAALCVQHGATKIVGLEARGFILAAPVSVRAGIGFIPVRKAGKLPGATLKQAYELEYGTAEIEVHAEDLSAGDRVMVIDDVLATGGTAEASLELIRRAGAEVAGVAVLMELGFLSGRERLESRPARRPAGRPDHGLSRPQSTAEAGPEESGARLRCFSRQSRHTRPRASARPWLDTMGTSGPDRGTRTLPQTPSGGTPRGALLPDEAQPLSAAQPDQQATRSPRRPRPRPPSPRRSRSPRRPRARQATAPAKTPAPAPVAKPVVPAGCRVPLRRRLLQPGARPPRPPRRAALVRVQPGARTAAADSAQQRPQDRDGHAAPGRDAPTRSPSAGTAARSARAATRTSPTPSR